MLATLVEQMENVAPHPSTTCTAAVRSWLETPRRERKILSEEKFLRHHALDKECALLEALPYLTSRLQSHCAFDKEGNTPGGPSLLDLPVWSHHTKSNVWATRKWRKNNSLESKFSEQHSCGFTRYCNLKQKSNFMPPSLWKSLVTYH